MKILVLRVGTFVHHNLIKAKRVHERECDQTSSLFGELAQYIFFLQVYVMVDDKYCRSNRLFDGSLINKSVWQAFTSYIWLALAPSTKQIKLFRIPKVLKENTI